MVVILRNALKFKGLYHGAKSDSKMSKHIEADC